LWSWKEGVIAARVPFIPACWKQTEQKSNPLAHLGMSAFGQVLRRIKPLRSK